jgi:tryptophan synthase alpha chain
MKLICYLSNGYPSFKESEALADIYVNAGCDIIEIDLPSRDPYLEGKLIASRMAGALATCNDYSYFMEAAARIRNRYKSITVLLLAYDSTIREIGVSKFVEFCITNNMRDLILVGRDTAALKNELIDLGMRISCYVQFHLPEEEVSAALDSNAFVYMQSKPISGNVNPLYPTLKDCIVYLRSLGINRPIYCGVGIYTPKDVLNAKQSGADGVFIGSAILNCSHDYHLVHEVVQKFKAIAN